MVETVLGMTDLQIKLFTAIGQIFVAAAVGYVALRQWLTANQQAETARKKLVLDMFDRRIKCYDRLKLLLTQIYPKERRDFALIEAYGLLSEIRWLFGPEVMTRVKTEVLRKFTEMAKASSRLEGACDEDERDTCADAYADALNQAHEAEQKLPSIFEKALTLRD